MRDEQIQNPPASSIQQPAQQINHDNNLTTYAQNNNAQIEE